jgi:DNA polymerase
MLKLCKPRPQWKKIGKGDKYFGTPKEFEQLRRYCEQDVRAEVALSKALAPLSPFERRIWLLDQKINKTGIHCDLPLIRSAIDLAEQEKERGKAEISELTDGEVTSPNQVAKLKTWINQFLIDDIPDLSAATVEATLKLDLHDEPRRALELRQRHSKSSVRKYQAMLDRADDQGVITENLLYYGAHTGRWAGMGIQPQNYPNPALSRVEIEGILVPAILERDSEALELFAGSIGEALSSTLRSALVAAPDEWLIGADYSSIEAVVLLWLAEEYDALDKFRSGYCLYRDMASMIFDKPYSQIGEKSIERKLGKVAILGLGYNMGWMKFQTTCKAWHNIEVSIATAKLIVSTYRAKYWKIKNLWDLVEDTAVDVVQAQICRPRQIPNNSHRPFNLSCSASEVLRFKLPSDSTILYPYPKIGLSRFQTPCVTYKGIDSHTHKWTRLETYGGKLVENAVQRLARDIMAAAMLEANNQGYTVHLTVHDEIVASIPKSQVTSKRAAVTEFEQILCSAAKWARGIPIRAKGWIGERYRK